jgi:putative Mn2+ efflux pump MntP
MTLPSYLLILVFASLSLDTLAVSVAVGLAQLSAAERFRFAAACSGSEAGMAAAGFVAGSLAAGLGATAEWLAIALLVGTGLWSMREAFGDDGEVGEAIERARRGGPAMLLAALAIGLDELAAGLALGAFRQRPELVIGAIAIQAFGAGMLGLKIGSAVGSRAGVQAQLLSGLALVAVALWLAALQLTGQGS